MPVRKRVTVSRSTGGSLDAQPLLDDMASTAQDAFRQAVQEAAEQLELEFYRELNRRIPTRRQAGTFVWSNDPAANARAAQWWFIAVRKGEVPTQNGRYNRTGNFQRSFDFRVESDRQEPDTYTVVIGANANALYKGFRYKWVVGTFDKRRGDKYRIPGHRATGWFSLGQLVDEVYDEFIARVGANFDVIVKRQNF